MISAHHHLPGFSCPHWTVQPVPCPIISLDDILDQLPIPEPPRCCPQLQCELIAQQKSLNRKGSKYGTSVAIRIDLPLSYLKLGYLVSSLKLARRGQNLTEYQNGISASIILDEMALLL